MADPVSTVVAQASTSSTWVDAPVTRSVSESDAGRLADLLSMQSTQSQSSGVQAGVQGHAVTGIESAVPKGNSMGDSLLRSLDAAGRNYKQKVSDIDRMLTVKPAEMRTSDLLRIQVQLIDTSMQVDLIAKAVSKATQHVNELTKMQ